MQILFSTLKSLELIVRLNNTALDIKAIQRDYGLNNHIKDAQQKTKALKQS